MGINKTPEGVLVTHPNWQGGTINNDAAILKAKGIQGLKQEDAYAKAIHKSGKIEVWFRSPERLKHWKNNTIDSHEFTIKILKS